MNMEYSVASTTVADDYEEDGVFRATSISIEMKKVGHSLCGCCCDTRRGTIIVGIIMIIASIISLATEGFGIFALDTLNSELANLTAATNTTIGENDDLMTSLGGFGENDDFASSMHQGTIDVKHTLQYSMVFSFFSIIFAVTSIYGATVFNIWPVVVNVTFLLAHSMFYFVTAGSFFGFIVASLWMYPQIMFIVEVQMGLMSSMTYNREAQSCCCINKDSRY